MSVKMLTREDIGLKDDYVRLFRLKGVRMLINDIYIRVYPNYGFLILIKDGDYVSFLHKRGVKRASDEGIILIEDKEKFAKYLTGTRSFMVSYADYKNTFLNKENYSKGEIEEFFNHLIKLLELYKYTDYNFTEGAHQKATEQNNTEFLGRLEEMGRFKNEMRDFINYVFVTDISDLDILLGKISVQKNVAVQDLKEYTYDEIIALNNGEKIDSSIIRARSQSTVLYNDGVNVKYMWGDMAQTIFDDFVSYETNNTKEVKGIGTSKGVVKGYARVGEADYDDFKKLQTFFEEMQQGEILVSETTSPDLMPAMKKAIAFVTNQGGMLSHAAIVAREFGIPCIVGTTNGTKIIKTGDYIEVDADNGIVRILN